MSDASITAHIRKFIADKVANNEVVVVDWLTHEIIGSKSLIEGDDIEFYRVCAYAHVREIVKRCVGKYDAKPASDRQLVLDGFEHLQVAYTVPRNGRIELVPVNLLTSEEIEARALEYEAMAGGCLAHAKELRGYDMARQAA